MIVDVALPIPVMKTFSYAVPEPLKPAIVPYLRIRVPFHNRLRTGVITGIREETDDTLKAVDDLVDLFPVVDDTLMELGLWAARYYLVPVGLVFKYILPSNLNLDPLLTIRTDEKEAEKMKNLSLKKAVKTFGRAEAGMFFRQGKISLHGVAGHPFLPLVSGDIPVTRKEDNCLFIGDVQNRLDYYIEAIDRQISDRKSVLMLLPDRHGSGAHFRKALTRVFGDRVLWYGTGMTNRSRAEHFLRVREGEGYVILGNKSCVFLPIANMGLVVVERHEEDEYRNEEGFKFNAVSVALKRADLAGVPAIVGSAAPSVEMYQYAKDYRFSVRKEQWLLDPAWRERMAVPDLFSSNQFLEELIPIIKEGQERGERIAVFTPRKDYGSYLLCHSCKKPLLCPSCEGVVGYHKEEGRLTCITCGKSVPYEERCGHCNSNIIRFSRIGAEYVVEKLTELFPGLRIVKVTGDSLRAETTGIRKASVGSPMVMVGTQSLSKLYGCRVDKLVLFGWEGLRKMGGYRSDERMLQILINLVDALTPGKTIFLMERRRKIDISGYGEPDQFYGEELLKRRDAEFPPFTRIFLIEVHATSGEAGKESVRMIEEVLHREGVEEALSGVMKTEKSGKRWRLILRGTSEELLTALTSIYTLRGVQIEADPLTI